MTAEMKRLLDDPTENGFDRLLLESGMDEAPPARSLDRTLSALGVGAAVTVAATTTSVGAGAAASKATATVAATSGGWLSLSVTKVVGAFAIAGLAVGGGYAALSPAEVPVAPRAAAVVGAADAAKVEAPAPERAAEPRSDKATVAEAPPPVIEPATKDATPTKPRASSAKKPTVGALAGNGSSSDALTPEITLLDQARAALSAGDADACLARIAAYHSRFPKGQLASDAKGIKARCEAKRSSTPTP